jgi:hypothetical protein
MLRGRIGRDLEHVNAVFTVSGMGQNQPFLCRQRLHQTVSADDFHDSFHVVGEHIQTHLRTHPGQLSRQEVRRTHDLNMTGSALSVRKFPFSLFSRTSDLP